MGLTLVTGRAHAGKSGLIREHLLEGLSQGKETTLLLPTFADVSRAREEFAEKAPVGLRITTFETWVESMWVVFGDGRRLVAPVVRRELMGRAVAGGTTTSLTPSPGLEDTLARVAARSAGLGRRADDDPIYRGIDEALTHYEVLLAEAGLIEPAAAALLLPDALGGGDQCIAANRYTDISPVQERCLLGIARDNEVAVALLWEDGFAATEATEEVVHRLIAAGATHVHVNAPGAHDELSQLEDQLFNPRNVLEATGAVILSEASGPEAEAAAVADAVSRALEDGVPPSRIVVVFRELSSRATRVEMALRARGVDPAIDMATELGSTPLGDCVGVLLRARTGAAGRGELLHFLRGPFSDASTETVDELDARWRRSRADRTPTLLADIGRLSPGLGGIVRSVRAVDSDTGVSGSGKKWESLVDSLLSADGGTTRDVPYLARLNEAAGRALVDSAAALDEAGLHATGERLFSLARNFPVAVGHVDRPGSVLVTEAHRVRSRRFDVVIIGGLTASEFSSEKPEPLGAVVLRGLGLPAGTDERLSERLLFYAIVTRSRDRLELVRQSSDAGGNGLRASVFWEEVVDAYRRPEQAYQGDEGRLTVSHRVSLSDFATVAPSVSVGRNGLRDAARKGGLPAPTVRRGLLGAGTSMCSPGDEFSVTEIETYLRCPYGWFYQRVVRPKELDREFGAAERGALAHLILAEFYARFRGQGERRVHPKNLARARTLLEEVSTQHASRALGKTQGIREELSVATARAWARTVVEEDAELLLGFEPAESEWAFGEGAGAPFEFGGVRLRGKADRVEHGAAGLVVTDYKSGQVKGQAGFAAEGLLQTVVYGVAAAQIRDVACVGGVYRSLSTGSLRGFWNSDLAVPETWACTNDVVDGERWKELVDWASDAVACAVEGMCAGRIERAPLNAKACAYCGAAPFCERGLE